MNPPSLKRLYHRICTMRLVGAIGRRLKTLLLFFAIAFPLSSLSCAFSSTEYTTLQNPQSALGRMKRAFDGDDVMGFLFTLSEETLDKYETKILAGWSEVRERLYFLQREIEIEDVQKIYPEYEDDEVSSDFVFPRRDKDALEVSVIILIDGEAHREKFLFVREIDAAQENTSASKFVRVRDEVVPKEEHPTPNRYQVEGHSMNERTQWRLVYPYYPYYSQSGLAQQLVAELRDEGDDS